MWSGRRGSVLTLGSCGSAAKVVLENGVTLKLKIIRICTTVETSLRKCVP